MVFSDGARFIVRWCCELVRGVGGTVASVTVAVVIGSEAVKVVLDCLVVWKKINGASTMFLASNPTVITMVIKGTVVQKGWQQIRIFFEAKLIPIGFKDFDFLKLGFYVEDRFLIFWMALVLIHGKEMAANVLSSFFHFCSIPYVIWSFQSWIGLNFEHILILCFWIKLIRF